VGQTPARRVGRLLQMAEGFLKQCAVLVSGVNQYQTTARPMSDARSGAMLWSPTRSSTVRATLAVSGVCGAGDVS